MSPVRAFAHTPSPLLLMLKAALPAVPGVSAIPGVKKTAGGLPHLSLVRTRMRVDQSHVDAYAEVCGFPHKDTLPLTYPHVLAFPLHLALLTDRSFPFPAMGLVHLENVVTQHRAVTAREQYAVTVSAGNLRAHAKGSVLDVVTEMTVGGELVWHEVSTFLSRGPGDERAPAGTDLRVVAEGGVQWHLGADLGRRYAAVSGDRNPIHLYAVTAKAFGFPRQIAHGMWSKARCVAAVENRLPDAVQVQVAFKTPVLLPATVRFSAARAELQGWEFGLVNPSTGAPHLAGRTRPL